jgi:hypothetical protein
MILLLGGGAPLKKKNSPEPTEGGRHKRCKCDAISAAKTRRLAGRSGGHWSWNIHGFCLPFASNGAVFHTVRRVVSRRIAAQ